MAYDVATELVRVVMPTGEEVWVRLEVDPGVTDSSKWRKGARLLGNLKNLDETIRGVVYSVGSSIARYSPAETEIEFGLEVAAETGGAVAVLAGAHASASVKVTMKWHKGEFPAQPDSGESGKEQPAAASPSHAVPAQ